MLVAITMLALGMTAVESVDYVHVDCDYHAALVMTSFRLDMNDKYR